ncbi:adenosylcobinamide-phosphate synthase CbiB [Pediococcus claussenii]|uniref:adenosylcobinamide-phosphate synthase CbiB n=1 Tax=Pediococcus claussenii TaxID=187452 RepID=UPI0007053B31|nr:adenosylcobinamide-phosphate synthase CbiB [Pediococcus claussenii]ANZ69146.1 adenosylcobinamide-phosphate synthase [Pediococcus claussenii]ANZ70963.1 adenosylcobinamide-phosphate synthase [Pediococcus claussenii]KRN20141.1 cbiB protein [Pediococcus claussenii]
MSVISMTVCGFLLDLLIGDPYSWPHPVKVIGNYIQTILNWVFKLKLTNLQKNWMGIAMWISVVVPTGLVIWGIMRLANFNEYIYLIVGTYFAYTAISVKGLAVEAHKIMKSVRSDNLRQARNQLGMIVGRETSQLTEEEVLKATIETVAENTCDGVIAPLCYLLIGGPTLGWIYKAVNTLDSMVGYKNEKFQYIGKASAIIDDYFNYIPARLTWLLMVMTISIMRLNTKEAITVSLRDRRKHNSPNSAFSESVVAGSLELQLGGPHIYFGTIVSKPFIGNPQKKTTTIDDVQKTIQILYGTALIALIIFGTIRFLIV